MGCWTDAEYRECPAEIGTVGSYEHMFSQLKTMSLLVFE